MKLLEVPYREFHGIFLPVIGIEIGYKNNFVPTSALADTGATNSIFSAGVAEILGIDLKEAPSTYIHGVGGGMIVANFHPVEIRVAGLSIPARVSFSEELGIPFNILGHEGFLEYFKVCFDTARKKFTFEVE